MSCKKVKCGFRFKDKRLTESEFSFWLKRDKDFTKAYCRLCIKNFSLAKHGVKALVMHASGSKHKARLPVGSQTELNFGNKEGDSQSEEIDKTSSQQSSSQTLMGFSHAKIYWVLKITIL